MQLLLDKIISYVFFPLFLSSYSEILLQDYNNNNNMKCIIMKDIWLLRDMPPSSTSTLGLPAHTYIFL